MHKFSVRYIVNFTKFYPSKHLLVFKTSWRRLKDRSWRRLQHAFRVKVFCLSKRLDDVLQRRLEDVLKTSWRHIEDILQDVLKTYWRCLGRRKIVTLNTSSRLLEDMSWRRLEDMSWRRLQDVLGTNNMFTGNIYI